LRPILRTEYQFLVTVCEPTKEERKQIARAGEATLRVAVTMLTDWRRQPRRAVPAARGAMPDPRKVVEDALAQQPPDPRKLLQAGLADAAKTFLSPRQVDRYREEVKQR